MSNCKQDAESPNHISFVNTLGSLLLLLIEHRAGNLKFTSSTYTAVVSTFHPGPVCLPSFALARHRKLPRTFSVSYADDCRVRLGI